MSRKTASRRREKRALTPLERRFVAEYCTDFRGGPALARAGSTAKYPDQQAYEMLRKPHVAEAVERQIAGLNERAFVNKQWVLNRLVTEYGRSSEAAENGKGKGATAERGHALRALEKIGQHVDVNAFRQQVGLGNPDGSNFDYSALSLEELHALESLLVKASLGGGHADIAGAPGGDSAEG